MNSAAGPTLLEDAALLERVRRSGRSIMEETALALEAGEMPVRYSRNGEALSSSDQARLARSTVLLAGCGGLGGQALENLVRAGVGRIIACDPDFFEPSNLNRQLLAVEQTMGKSKAQSAAERAGEVNPLVQVTAVAENVKAGMLEGAGVVADCLGGAKDRRQLQRLAEDAGLPLVSAGVSGFSALVCSTWPGESGLGEFMHGTMLGSEDVQGVLAPTVAYAASLQAAEIIQILTTGSSSLRGNLLVADIAAMRFNTVSLSTAK